MIWTKQLYKHPFKTRNLCLYPWKQVSFFRNEYFKITMKYFQDNLSEMREDVRKMKTSKIDLERDANDRSQKKVHIEGQLKQVVVSLLQFFLIYWCRWITLHF